MANSLSIAAQNASPTSAPPSEPCNFCRKPGLFIFPVRCATLPADAKAPALPDDVGVHVKDIDIKLSTYTLRMARVGYFYMLVDRNGALSWQCYMSNAAGYLSEFAVDTPPLIPPVFSCDPMTHGVNASLIAIDKAEEVQTAYLLFTPNPLTSAMLGEMELKNKPKAEVLCAKGQMVKFSPSEWVAGKHKQRNCMTVDVMRTGLAEFVRYDKTNDGYRLSPIAKGLANATFPLMTTGDEEDKETAYAMGLQQLLRISPLHDFMFKQKAVTVAVYDHIGVAQELNDFRNHAYNKVDDFLNKKDQEQVTNRWRFDSLQAIREVKAAMERGMIGNLQANENMTELYIRSLYEPMFPGDSSELVKFKMGLGRRTWTYEKGRDAWLRAYPKEAAEMEARLQKRRDEIPVKMARVKQEAKEIWDKKYHPLLDHAAIDNLDKAFDAAGKAAMDAAKERVNDHLKWVNHERLLGAFDMYDQKDPVSGKYFAEQVSRSAMGMTGSQKSSDQVTAWIQAKDIVSRQNIYMRGLFLNQQDIQEEAKKALKDAENIAAAAASVAKIDGQKMYKALKSLADLFRKADSAWDEFLRKQNQVKGGFPRSIEGKTLFLFSEINKTLGRALLGSAASKPDMKLIGLIGGFAFARTGKLAEKLQFEELVYGICPEKPNKPVTSKSPQNPDGKHVPTMDARREIQLNERSPKDVETARKQIAAMQKNAIDELEAARGALISDVEKQHLERMQGVKYTIDEYINDPRTNNLHHARIGVLLGLMETIALGGKAYDLHNGKGNPILYAETVSNLMSVVSISFDIPYALIKSGREQAELANAAKSVVGAGDIVRGGFKMWAGVFGTLAGSLSVYADWLKFKEEIAGKNRTPEETFLLLRMIVGVFNTGAGALAAFSYTGPMFRRVAINLTENAVARRAAATWLASKAERWAARVFLLRVVAWGTGAGFVLTAGEILWYAGEAIIVSFQPNALETWCARSAFRNRVKNGKPYGSSQNELEQLAKARLAVLGK
ncbi:T6SS effector BTH_I2691 family protein [Janthinobacterium sp. 17J80-10]|uniref:T6SS effector BTH_I2691 family protein n=1 Tax=Janthinobacterium sp. 17J80-10 TaxID=2497863 RepID=UPI00100547DD|nr:T6SS effector BTH_I2691 family protein [Janthinobacterium sp. 17J80-10]QAU34202.1 hypothetical protein EKL02_08390 [Janthinobacterium sp. 17J80-10]